MTNEVTLRRATLPADLMSEMAAAAKDAAAAERPSTSKISLRNGMISYMGEPVKDNKLSCIVMCASHVHAYYDGPYDPDKLRNPTCFAISMNGVDMKPHENVAHPMSDACATCPMNEWGSAGNGRKGKACKQTRRLVLLPASAADSAEEVQKAEMAIVDLPVTSQKEYGKLVNQVAAVTGLPVWGAITMMSVAPDQRTQFKVSLTPTETIEDPDVLRALKARVEEAERIAITPYDQTQEDEEGKQPPAKEIAGQTSKRKKF